MWLLLCKVKLPQKNTDKSTVEVPFSIKKKAQTTVTKREVALKPELTAEERKKLTKEKIAVRKRNKKLLDKLEKGSTKQELAAAEKLAFTEAVVFDSPALAAVKKMFDQLKQEVKVEENRLGITGDVNVGEEKFDLMENSQSEELKFMSR